MSYRTYKWVMPEDNNGEKYGIDVNAKSKEDAVRLIAKKHPSSPYIIKYVTENEPYVAQEGEVDIYVRGAILIN